MDEDPTWGEGLNDDDDAEDDLNDEPDDDEGWFDDDEVEEEDVPALVEVGTELIRLEFGLQLRGPNMKLVPTARTLSSNQSSYCAKFSY